MATLSDHDLGIYVLQTWAGVAQVSPPDVIANFKARYSDDLITLIGKMAENVSFDSLKSEFSKILPSYDSQDYVNPSRADLNQALLNVGGELPSTTTLVEEAVTDTATQVGNFSFSALKYIAIIAAVAGLGYVAWQLGWLKNAASRVRS